MAGVNQCSHCLQAGMQCPDCAYAERGATINAMLSHVRSEVARLKRHGPASSGIAHTLSVILKQLEKIAEGNES